MAGFTARDAAWGPATVSTGAIVAAIVVPLLAACAVMAACRRFPWQYGRENEEWEMGPA